MAELDTKFYMVSEKKMLNILIECIKGCNEYGKPIDITNVKNLQDLRKLLVNLEKVV